VVRNDSNCLLTIDNIVTADGVYIGAPPITLDTGDEYEESASAFAIAGEGSFFRANAKISALTFATDFTISLIVSDTLSASDEGSISATPFIRLPDLLRARSFAALSAQTLTNTGSQTVIAGDLGVSPGTSVTGLPVGQPSGVTYRGTDSPAVEAQTDLTTLYNDLVSRNCPIANRLSGQDLADKTLPPGVYCFASTASLGVGTLTLDAKGKPGAVWIFQVGSALNVAPSSVNVINGGTACNVFWQVGSSATLLGNALFAGNLVVYTSVTLNNGAAVAPGRVLVRTGAVTLDTNHVSSAACQ